MLACRLFTTFLALIVAHHLVGQAAGDVKLREGDHVFLREEGASMSEELKSIMNLTFPLKMKVISFVEDDVLVRDAQLGVMLKLDRRFIMPIEESVSYFDGLVKSDPRSARAWYLRALAHAARGEYVAARADLNSSLRLDAKLASTHDLLGYVYFNSREFDKAEREFSESIRLDPSRAASFEMLGNLKSVLGDLKGSLVDLNKAVILDKLTSSALVSRAHLWLKLKEPLQALADCDEGIRKHLSSPMIYYTRARAASDLGRLGEALKDHTRAIMMEPSMSIAYSGRSRTYLRLGSRELALADINKSIELSPEVSGFYSNRALILIEEDKLDEAMVDLNLALERDRRNILALYARGVVWFRRGDVRKASRDYDAALGISPTFWLALFERSKILEVRGDYRGALATLREVAKLEPAVAPIVHCKEAWILSTCGDATVRDGNKALEMISKCEQSADKVGIDKSTISLVFAVAYAESGRFTSAVQWQQRAIEENSEPAEHRAWLDKLLKQFSNKDPYRFNIDEYENFPNFQMLLFIEA